MTKLTAATVTENQVTTSDFSITAFILEFAITESDLVVQFLDLAINLHLLRVLLDFLCAFLCNLEFLKRLFIIDDTNPRTSLMLRNNVLRPSILRWICNVNF